jgi:hypothetical protein
LGQNPLDTPRRLITKENLSIMMTERKDGDQPKGRKYVGSEAERVKIRRQSSLQLLVMVGVSLAGLVVVVVPHHASV